MKNYICINGNKTALTDEQIIELGFTSGTITVAELSNIVISGKAREHFKIRDVVTLFGIELEIIGFDHDKIAGDETRHTITLMAKVLCPERRWHSGSCERGWIDSEIRAWLNEEYIEHLPAELAAHIHSTEKLSHNYKGDAFTTTDKLFIPSESELFGSAIWSDYEDGPRYEAFTNCETRVRVDEAGDRNWYWTRSAHGGDSTSVAYVSSNGTAGSGGASNTTIRAPLCFLFS